MNTPWWWVKWAILAVSLATLLLVVSISRYIRKHSAIAAVKKAESATAEAKAAHTRLDRHDIEIRDLQDDGTELRTDWSRLWGRVKFLSSRTINDELQKQREKRDGDK